MRIIEQISEDTFVVKMDEYDLQKEDAIKVAHDYVSFYGNVGMTTENSVEVHGKYASCNNWIKQCVEFQIPIREMITLILPYLNRHPYCSPDHLETEEGKPNYTYGNNIVFYTNPKTKEDMVAIRTEGEEEFTIITRKLYNYLKNK